MTILDEAMKPKTEDFAADVATPVEPEREKGMTLLDIIRIETGPGSLDEYKESPLNFDRSEGLSRVLRGLAGFIGADVLKSALVDVVIGVLQWSRGKVKPIAQG